MLAIRGRILVRYACVMAPRRLERRLLILKIDQLERLASRQVRCLLPLRIEKDSLLEV